MGADRPRFEEEGIWRRTQQEETAENSGWTGEGAARRRIVHYQHQYGLVDTTAAPALAMTQLCLYHSVAAPRSEIEEAWEQNHAMLSEGGWKHVGQGRFELGDLRVHLIRMEQHPEDLRAGRRLPADYEVIDTVFTSVNCFPPRAVRRRPWEVLTHGVRVKDTPGKPVYADDLAQLTDFLPFQVEVSGGGAKVSFTSPPGPARFRPCGPFSLRLNEGRSWLGRSPRFTTSGSSFTSMANRTASAPASSGCRT